ncbi:hypothetical protein [Methanoculleus sp. UBA377]|uniref:hypothetical protein n=1 Tax=Methanoculleus sp. UBA377 TaxID=1915506 RepID=UPI0025FD3851|nr:hypothetical protein [Methanoculleus sp. UBA377]
MRPVIGYDSIETTLKVDVSDCPVPGYAVGRAVLPPGGHAPADDNRTEEREDDGQITGV